MEKFVSNIKTAFDSNHELGDDAGFIDEILFIVGIALAALAVSWWIGGAAMNKGADIAACIEGMNVTATSSSATDCQNQNHAEENNASFKNDTAYRDRFGND